MNKVKLGSVTDSCLGKMLDAEKNKGSYQPYLANLNVRWGSFDLNNLSQMRFEEHEQERYGIRAGDLIMCEGGEPGRCAIWRDELPDMKIQKALHRIRPHACLDVHYLYYWFLLAGRLGWLDRHFTETTIKHLPGDKLKDVEIDMPSLAVQKGIADVLSSFDDKITHNASICAELESMAKTLYDYWFVQFDFPDANGKPYRTSGGEMVWNEQLKREIPKGWNVYYVSDCCDIIDCLHSEKPKKEFENEDAFLLQLENLVDNGLVDITNKYYVSVEMYKLWTSRVEVRSGDLLVTNAGRAGAVYRMPEGVCAGMGRNMTAIRPNKVPPTLLYYFFTSRDMETQIKANTDTGAFFKSLNVRGIKQLRIVLPQTNESAIMHELEKRLSSIRHLVEQLSKESTELARLRDWLLPMLMNGQATVAPAKSAPKLQVLQPEKPARDPHFDRWLQTQGVAARGTVDEQTLHDIFDAMDDNDKQ